MRQILVWIQTPLFHSWCPLGEVCFCVYNFVSLYNIDNTTLFAIFFNSVITYEPSRKAYDKCGAHQGAAVNSPTDNRQDPVYLKCWEFSLFVLFCFLLGCPFFSLLNFQATKRFSYSGCWFVLALNPVSHSHFST